MQLVHNVQKTKVLAQDVQAKKVPEEVQRMNVREAYERIENLEAELRTDLGKALFIEDIFQAHADFAREYLRALGKEVDYHKVEEAVRESSMMKKINLQMDKVKFSYNDLVRDIARVRRDSIAKSLVTMQGPDDVHSLKKVLLMYGINPQQEGDMFSKATYIISETRKGDIEKRFGPLVCRNERMIPNNMSVSDFIFLLNKYASSTSNREVLGYGR